MRVSRLAALCSALALGLIATAVVAPAASAAPDTQSRATSHAPAYRYYLSVGDSLGFGYSDVKMATFLADPAHPVSDFTGYTDDLAASLGVAATNYSCPGETTTSMIGGGCPWTAAGAPLHAAYSGTQLSAATAFLRTHRWQRGLVTVSIGSNDVLPVAASCLSDPACPALWPTLATMRSNLSTILRALRGAAPFATIVVLAPYNPFGHAAPLSNVLAAAFDLSIAGVSLMNFDPVADAFAPINGRYPTTFDCGNLVYFCASPANGDVHPTNAGYAVIAGAFQRVLR